MLFGEAVDCETGARGQARTPWEGDVLLNFDALENALDFAFLQLGINTPTVDHRIFMTERLATPLHSRALTSELLFELYSVPEVTYCVDGIMSFYKNNKPTKPFNADGLAISFNTASTSVIPILNGKGILSHAKRIPWGASQASEYLLKLIQLKYSSFPTRVTSLQTNWMLKNLCSFVPDYLAHVRSLKSPEALRASECIIQFPFAAPVQEEKTEEELAKIAEKRKEQGKKLQEMAAKNRAEKLQQKENDLQYLTSMREGRASDSRREWNNKLQSEGFDSDAALDQAIKKLEGQVTKARKKEQGIAEPDEPVNHLSLSLIPQTPSSTKKASRRKRNKRLLKAGYEARARARKEKEKEREEKEREEKKEEEERENDLEGWSNRLRSEQEALMTRIKDRARRKAALSDRKSAASQARMKNIANLANDDRVPKKKRKGGGEDMFGADDADWAIYRKINIANVSSDEEDDLDQLKLVEQKLLQHDPTFTAEQTHAAISSQRSALLTAFKPAYEDGDIRGHARIHLTTERWRVCETWFSPSLAGVDSAGLGEVIQNVLARFSEAEKERLVDNIFLTGGPSQLSGLPVRLHTALRPVLPPEMPVRIRSAEDPTMDAWYGMNKLNPPHFHHHFPMLDSLKFAQFTNSTFVDNSGQSDFPGILILRNHILEDAAHDSYARESKSDCFPGTRAQYIEDLTTWATSISGQRRHRLFWMQGPAGVGKTTIAQTVAKETEKHGALGASFFFSQDNGVVDASRFFNTIAFQLATQNPEYRTILDYTIHLNPALPKKRLEVQLRELIIGPFLLLKDRKVQTQQKAIIVDGLDECGDNDRQSEIVRLVSQLIEKFGSHIPLLWAFFSRPEYHLTKTFLPLSPLCWQVELPISRDIDSEIKLYLRGTLRNPQQLDGLSTASLGGSQWPSENDLNKLVEIAAGLFIYATTIARFINDPHSPSPRRQLHDVLLFHERPTRVIKQSNPMSELDSFYGMIMSRISAKTLPFIQRLLLLHHELPATYIPDDCWNSFQYGFGLATMTPVRLLANMAGVSFEELEKCLLTLRLVLTIEQAVGPGRVEWGSETIHFYHASFMEFLLNPERSMQYCLNQQDTWLALAIQFVRLSQEMYKINDLERDQKIDAINLSLSAPPGRHLSVSKVLEFRNELYTYLHWNLLKFCGRVNIETSHVLAQELSCFNFEAFSWLGLVEIGPGLLTSFPENIRPQLRNATVPAQAHKLGIEATLSHPPSFSADIDKCIGYLTSGLDAILSGHVLPHNRISTFGDFLYQLMSSGSTGCQYIRSYLARYFRVNSRKPPPTRANGSEMKPFHFLHYYSDEWNRYRHLFHIPIGSKAKFPVLKVTTARLYCELIASEWEAQCFVSMQGKDRRLFWEALNLITQQRNGDLVNGTPLSLFFHSLDTMDYWIKKSSRSEHFKNVFDQATFSYYSSEAERLLASDTLDSFLKHADSRLREENTQILPRLFTRVTLPNRRWHDASRSHNDHSLYHNLRSQKYSSLLQPCRKGLVASRKIQLCMFFEETLANPGDDSENQLQLIYSIISQPQILPMDYSLHDVFLTYVKGAVLATISSAARNPDARMSASAVLELLNQKTGLGRRIFRSDFSSRDMDDVVAEVIKNHPELEEALRDTWRFGSGTNPWMSRFWSAHCLTKSSSSTCIEVSSRSSIPVGGVSQLTEHLVVEFGAPHQNILSSSSNNSIMNLDGSTDDPSLTMPGAWSF
ncbi:hypothetical protein NP233_g9789 [Leucocoprinus birnbaumii]|uniref:NACHT domain-containing protein n=1 Tax=Leucocoprinus birnbaumii TaxID=56174 RepID=A0AAD5VJS2_9AGAR|nr:hypothetical protein NP233_g9789 [Leucocoprinus birnbaumii]